MDELGYIIRQGASPDRTLMGGKAAALAELDGKFNIPAWFVISPRAFLDCLSATQKQQLASGQAVGEVHFDTAIRQMVVDATAKLAGPEQWLAVRSSATAEDGKQASFAGQLDSYLNVAVRQVPETVKAVWSSAFTTHVMQYRKTVDSDAESIPAVIVQRMVKADVSGVAFSVDPVTGDQNTCVINATTGLADKLVSGEVNGDTYHTSKSGKIKRQSLDGALPLLSQEMASQIVDLALKAEAHFKMPQDIEWAIQEGKLYLLQSRPVTALYARHSSCQKTTLWDNSNIVESYSGVTAPLTFSFARYVYEHVYIEFCQFMGVRESKVENENNAFRNLLGFVGGHVYYNLVNWYRVLALFPGFRMNRSFMEQMMGVREPLPESIVKSIVPVEPSLWERITDGFNFSRTLGGLIWHQIKLPVTIRRFYERLNESLSSSEALDQLSLAQLGTEYRVLESKLLKKWDAPLINDFLCMIAFGLSRKLLEKYVGNEGLGVHNDIMIGQGDIVSAEPAVRIRKMADIVRNDSKLVDRLIQGDLTAIDENAELKSEYEDYLDKFGDRCLQELKLESLTLHDDPTMLLQAIGYMARREKQQVCPEKQNDIDTLLTPFFKKNPLKRWFVIQMVTWAKARVRDRENLRFERTRVFGRVRNIFLAIGNHFHERQYINDPRDIFFLEVSEIMGLIEGTATIMAIDKLIELRVNQQHTFKSQSAPPNRFEVYGAAYPAFINQDFHTSTHSAPLTSGSLQGIGCCQGRVIAPVKVIRNPHDAEIKPGEIMVAEFTDPGWITLFANASGILVERGSLLSHSAIVAREMGIPAIVAIDGVMTELNNGDVVEMNGTTGIVRKITSQSDYDKKK